MRAELWRFKESNCPLFFELSPILLIVFSHGVAHVCSVFGPCVWSAAMSVVEQFWFSTVFAEIGAYNIFLNIVHPIWAESVFVSVLIVV